MARESCNLDKKEEAEILKPTSPSPPSSSPPQSSSASPALFMNMSSSKKPNKAEKRIREEEEEEQSSKASPLKLGNRCSCCRKRVGLTGFRCRCGELFCGKHRYSDVHDCSFDYKALGRQEISKANPLIRAAKIIKI